MWCHLRDGVLFLNPDRPHFITAEGHLWWQRTLVCFFLSSPSARMESTRLHHALNFKLSLTLKDDPTIYGRIQCVHKLSKERLRLPLR